MKLLIGLILSKNYNNMKIKTLFILILDLTMTISLLFLMPYQVIIGEKGHEFAGMLMSTCFIVHIVMNKWWYKNLLNGKYNLFRFMQTIINFAIMITMFSSMISGIMMSRHIFTLISVNTHIEISRVMHMLAAYWGFLLMSFHLGLHWGMIFSHINKIMKLNKKLIVICRFVGFTLAVYGGYVFKELDLFSHMFLKKEYFFFDFNQSPLLVLFNYFSIMGLWIFIAHYFMKIIKSFQIKDLMKLNMRKV